MTLRNGLALITPPIIWRFVRRIRGGKTEREWEYFGSTWPPHASMRGWNVESVVQTQRSKWPELVLAAEGSGLLAAGGLAPHNTLMTWAYALGRAASGRQALTFLDWGGGLGQYGLLARALFPAVNIEYSCCDLPLMAEAGRGLLPDVTFYGADDEAFAREYDFVLASGSLHYVSDWRRTLTGLAKSTRGWLFVTRLPVVDSADSFVVVQRPAVHGYDTEYPGWVLNRTEFLSSAGELGLVAVREFLIGEEPVVPNAPEQPVYRGFLFERSAS